MMWFIAGILVGIPIGFAIGSVIEAILQQQYFEDFQKKAIAGLDKIADKAKALKPRQ
jgi:hypothetical protein